MTPAEQIRGLQVCVEAWRVRNYGPCQPWEQLLGLAEELGESYESLGNPDTSEFGDSIGDSAIYLLNYCTSRGWDASELYAIRDSVALPSRPWPELVGKLAHHFVKGEVQKYRGTREEHNAKGKLCVAGLFAHWEKLCAGMGTTFLEVLEKTWDVVSKRDWTKTRAVPSMSRDSRVPARVFEGLVTGEDGVGFMVGKFGGDEFFDGLEDRLVRVTVEALDESTGTKAGSA